jgi:hypothetical protein
MIFLTTINEKKLINSKEGGIGTHIVQGCEICMCHRGGICSIL